MPIRDRDYHKDVQIDVNDLENEWVQQSALYLYYGEAHAEAVDTRDRQKQNLELMQAKLDIEYRKEWDQRFPDTKMTENGIKAVILQDMYYKKALNLYNNANHNVNLMLVAKTALDHKKKGLENLVSLKISGFYSAPKPPTQKQGNETHKNHTQQLNATRQKITRQKSTRQTIQKVKRFKTKN